jgi:hypothetical protein
MILLRNRDERMAARVEVKRIKELSPAELGAAIMPVFGPGGPPVKKPWWGARGIEVLQIAIGSCGIKDGDTVNECVYGTPLRVPFTSSLMPVLSKTPVDGRRSGR